MQARRVNYRRVSPRNTMPGWIKAGLLILSAAIVMMLIAQGALSGYLAARQAQREAEYQKMVAEHPLTYRELIETYALANNLEPAFVAAIIMTESSYRKDALSSADARGLMQVTASTGKWIAGKIGEADHFTPERLYDPETNIRFGTWYLNHLAGRFGGDPVLVAGAYHAGPTEIQNWVLAGADSLESFMDGPTKNYARKVTTSYAIYQKLYFAPDAQMLANPDQY